MSDLFYYNSDSISKASYIRFCKSLLKQCDLIRQDHDNLSLFCADVDLTRLENMIKCEIKDCSEK